MPVSTQFQSHVDELQTSLFQMGEVAGKLLGEAVASFVTKDAVLAREVIQRDEYLDLLEDEHEEHAIQTIALNQPVARDLRMLVAFLRINTTIERAGDLAVNIAHSTLRICDKPAMRPYVDIPREYELVRNMWDDAIRSFVDIDAALAGELRSRDDKVDRLNQETITQIIEIGRDTPEFIYQATNAIGVSKALERIADLAVDIADEVVFVRRGELMRHAKAPQSNTA